MNSLWKTILDGLTYKDLAGKRQPRVYTVFTGLILLLLLIAGGMAGWNRYLLMSRVQATPALVSTPTQTVTPLASDQPAVTPLEGSVSSGCPTDPSEWSFTPTVISENYQVIQPACVYQGLEKTIAWALAVREGYSRAEATQQLSLTEMPMRQMESVTIPSDADGLVDVPVSFIPPDPDFTEWRVNALGESSITYALRGCFRTSSVAGNRLEIWGGDYSVMCIVIEDAEGSNAVYQLGDYIYTSPTNPTRSFLLFGYTGNDLWVWLGTRSDPKIEINDPDTFARDRLTIATLYDSQPWDMQWLKAHYDLEMQPLPDDWSLRTDEKDKQAILSGLNNGMEGGRE